MGMLTHLLNQTCTIIETAQNAYGDQVEEDTEEVDCRFREITEVQAGGNREELAGADAMFWFEPDTAVIEGTLIKYDDRYWRVTRLVKARKMDEPVQFIKCLVERHAGPAEEDNGES